MEVGKTFHSGDDAFSGPLGPARVPNSLVLELLAMTGGELIFQHLARRRVPLLLKAHDVRFESPALADEELRASAELTGVVDVSPSSSTAETTASVHGRAGRIATGRLLYVCVDVDERDIRRYRAAT